MPFKEFGRGRRIRIIEGRFFWCYSVLKSPYFTGLFSFFILRNTLLCYRDVGKSVGQMWVEKPASMMKTDKVLNVLLQLMGWSAGIMFQYMQ